MQHDISPKIQLGVCLFLVTLSGVSLGATHYVTPGQSIQAAIDAAVDTDEIEVAPGTYTEAIDFNGKAVRLYSSGGPEVTTIDGTRHFHVVQCVSGEGPDTILEGFTVTGGNANGKVAPDIYGGGMYISRADPTVTDCVFTGNAADDMGAGMYIYESSPAITGCKFINNTSQDRGGAIFVRNLPSHPTLTDCTFTGNSAVNFAGAFYMADCLATLTDCDFSGNTCGVYGGAVYIWRSPPTFTRCTFTENRGGKAGAIFNNDSSHSVITDCTFTLNESDNHGGAITIETNGRPRITGCLFSRNQAVIGGGAIYNNSGSDADITDCRFIRNTAGGNGGAIENYISSPEITGCLFDRNEAQTAGGAMFSVSRSYPAIVNCIFRANSTPGHGGGAANQNESNPAYINCVFSDNAAGRGGAMANFYRSNPVLTNCTFSRNTASNYGGGIYSYNGSRPVITNSIVWGNGPDEVYNEAASVPVISYSDIRGGYAGTGNIDADPAFADPDNPDAVDLRLTAGSPCIDAGDTTAVPEGILYDLDGQLRRVDDPLTVDTGIPALGQTVDMGAFEFQAYRVRSDINGDGRVDALDLAILSSYWLEEM